MSFISFLENPHQLEVIDQRKLPMVEVKVRLRTVDEVKKAIESMMVRGAPLIGICGAYGIALAAEYNEDLDTIKRELDATRPTAVNLMYATSRMVSLGKKLKENKVLLMFEEVRKIAQEEYSACEKMAELGSSVIPSKPRENQTAVNIIHHCNTGGLATYGIGTALGCIIKRAQIQPNVFVWVDETRPRLQGSKLTAWELNRLKIPNQVIVDGAAGMILSTGLADCVFFGADRIATNGDVVNKIGTYSLSVVAKENGIPVYCVAPTSTIDLSIINGNSVKIEKRNENEILEFDGKRFVDDATKAFNPAFDVTPNKYITAIITEEGICYPPFQESVVAAKHRAIKQKGENVDNNKLHNETLTKTKPPTATTITSSSERLFSNEHSTTEEKKPLRKEDAQKTKQKTYLGDGSSEPKVELIRDEPRFTINKTFLGDGSSNNDSATSATQSSVRQFGEVKKSSILLTDEAQPNQDVKSSIRVVQKTKQNTLFGEEEQAVVTTKSSRNKSTNTNTTDQPSQQDSISKGHVEIKHEQENDKTLSKGHVEPPKHEQENDKVLLSKAHFTVPVSPEKKEPQSQSKAHFSPSSQPSNVFG